MKDVLFIPHRCLDGYTQAAKFSSLILNGYGK